MSNPNPKINFRFPKIDTPEGEEFQDRCIEKRMQKQIIKQWLRDEVSKWSTEQIQEYINNPENPFIRRNFLETVVMSKKTKDQFTLLEHLEGKPKQEIETTLNTPNPITLEMYGDAPIEE